MSKNICFSIWNIFFSFLMMKKKISSDMIFCNILCAETLCMSIWFYPSDLFSFAFMHVVIHIEKLMDMKCWVFCNATDSSDNEFMPERIVLWNTNFNMMHSDSTINEWQCVHINQLITVLTEWLLWSKIDFFCSIDCTPTRVVWHYVLWFLNLPY